MQHAAPVDIDHLDFVVAELPSTSRALSGLDAIVEHALDTDSAGLGADHIRVDQVFMKLALAT
jgi:hypothetical protein